MRRLGQFQSPRKRCAPTRNGFTLIEILTVIAILSVLAALAAPFAGNMLNKSRSAKSMTNKRQIYTAITLFHSDHNRLPSVVQVDEESEAWNLDTGWHTIINPYLQHDEFSDGKRVGVSDVSFCPRAEANNKMRGDYGIAYDQSKGPVRRETRNAAGQNVSTKLSLSFQQIQHLRKTPLLADCEQRADNGGVVGSWFFNPTGASLPGLSRNPRLSFRHDGKTQMVFCDGSIRSLSEEELYGEVLPWKNEP
jgi:prepilin-type N-terminal cleavage/methylation domain-containing protein/prepilin-type processing-associated H-X9-DG protein